MMAYVANNSNLERLPTAEFKSEPLITVATTEYPLDQPKSLRYLTHASRSSSEKIGNDKKKNNHHKEFLHLNFPSARNIGQFGAKWKIVPNACACMMEFLLFSPFSPSDIVRPEAGAQKIKLSKGAIS